jgi:hypothetical protein
MMMGHRRSLLDHVLALVLALLQDGLWVEWVVVLLVLVAVPHVEAAGLAVACDCRPARPHQTLHADCPFRHCLRVLADGPVDLLHVVRLQRPLLAVEDDALELWLSWVNFGLIFQPFFLLFGL